MKSQKIIPLNKDMEYIDAFNAVRDKGGLPSNVLYDDSFQNDRIWESLRKIAHYGVWCRELVAYPEKYGVFSKGDIKDSDYAWTLPAKYVPKGIVGKKGIALLIDPKDLLISNGIMTVIPKNVTILQNFPQTNRLYDFDKKTRMPIDGQPKGTDYWDARYLWRRNSQTLRPLARYDYVFYVRRGVFAGWWPYYRLGVGWVEGTQTKLEKVKICPKCKQEIR